MKLDLHVHSSYSADGKVSPRTILKAARKKRLDGISITDHNTMKGSLEAKAMEKEFNLVVIRGMEISSADGHILAYGVDSEIEKHLGAKETVAEIKKNGGLASVAHPYRWWSGLGEKNTIGCEPDAIETFNAGSIRNDNFRARKLCRKMKVRKTAGSDAHDPQNIGKAYIIIENCTSEEDVLKAIRKGPVKTFGTSKTGSQSVKHAYESIIHWAGRGFKRM
jgi:predicted metal-dependent phosphoesterase TrpH